MAKSNLLATLEKRRIERLAIKQQVEEARINLREIGRKYGKGKDIRDSV
jgi:hypothetical protein